jgi:3-hydroxyacyl-[acyl-carrier-protein] dehydratase
MYNYIFDHLPYRSSFRFVDEISFLDADKVIGHYTLKKDAFFYEDHFVGYPVTPGAILTEIMGQIGLVVLGIYLITKDWGDGVIGDRSDPLPPPVFPLLTSVDVSFYRMVLPEQRVTVTSKKDYFRFDKLKCRVEMLDASGELVAKGVFSGMIKKVKK